MTFPNRAKWKSSERGKKTPTYCKSSSWGPSLFLFLCLSLSFSYMQAPVLAALENVRSWTGRGWRAVGGGGLLRQGRKNDVSEVFRHHICLTFLPISNKFSHSSWNRALPFTGLLSQAGALCSESCTHPYRQEERVCIHEMNSQNTSFFYHFRAFEMWIESQLFKMPINI